MPLAIRCWDREVELHASSDVNRMSANAVAMASLCVALKENAQPRGFP